MGADFPGHAVGRCLRESEAANELGIDPALLRQLTEQKAILAITTADDARVWPMFQFWLGWIRPAIGPLLWAFDDTGPDPWTLAVWMNRHHDGLRSTPAQSLDPGATMLAAQDQIMVWKI